jgi:predicted Fe-S protein YdhL (DUF1289 family)
MARELQLKTSPTRTPCIGVCSTTSVGDAICRGCKRYAFEVIRWNSYLDVEKEAVLRRIETLTVQILKTGFTFILPRHWKLLCNTGKSR